MAAPSSGTVSDAESGPGLLVPPGRAEEDLGRAARAGAQASCSRCAEPAGAAASVQLGVRLPERSTRHGPRCDRPRAGGSVPGRGAADPGLRGPIGHRDRPPPTGRPLRCESASSTLATTRCRTSLHEVHVRYPGLVIHQVEASVPQQYQQLTDGRLDVGIGRAALAPPLVTSLAVSGRTRWGPGSPSGHRFAELEASRSLSWPRTLLLLAEEVRVGAHARHAGRRHALGRAVPVCAGDPGDGLPRRLTQTWSPSGAASPRCTSPGCAPRAWLPPLPPAGPRGHARRHRRCHIRAGPSGHSHDPGPGHGEEKMMNRTRAWWRAWSYVSSVIS